MNKSKKKIIIITMSARAGHFYSNAILDIFGSDKIETTVYTAPEYKQVKHISDINLYLNSKSCIAVSGFALTNVPLGIPIVDVNSDFMIEEINELHRLPDGTKCLMVNSNELLCMECIVRLHKLGINNIEFIPMFPGKKPMPDVKIAFTPGESELIPYYVNKVYDSGCRHLTPSVICEIAIGLDMEYILSTNKFSEYSNKFTVDNTYIDEIFIKTIQLNKQINMIINSFDGGVIGINEDNNIFCINDDATKILNLNTEKITGFNYRKFLPFIDIKKYSNSENDDPNTVIRYNNVDIKMSIKPITENSKYKGVIIKVERFIDAENNQQKVRMKTYNKGHSSKYTFSDIVGNSEKIDYVRTLAKKMAFTNASILITGESGTGKELLAGAIHNYSMRKEYPFIAINCAAMPETLLESELFGYEEGAFTGAKKGGKLGLFEYAHSGTIFLDEIENMSPALQVKLLRVLQEKEVMRVGGTRIIKVDVRILAATNINLQEMVCKGKIRKDLYYRLNTMELFLPSLNDRIDDIPVLTEHITKEINGHFKLSDEVMKVFLKHDWDGNIRELKNCLEFLECLNKDIIEISDLPNNFTRKILKKDNSSFNEYENSNKLEFTEIRPDKQDLMIILDILYQCYNNKELAGRRSIEKIARESNIFLTEHEIRARLKILEIYGFVKVGSGRAGTRITPLGIQKLLSSE